jgi:hypothetical protein
MGIGVGGRERHGCELLEYGYSVVIYIGFRIYRAAFEG